MPNDLDKHGHEFIFLLEKKTHHKIDKLFMSFEKNLTQEFWFYSSSVTWLTKIGRFILVFPHFGVPPNYLEVQ